MKKIFVPAAIVAALVSAVACHKDDDKPTGTQAKVQGKWGVQSLVIAGGGEDDSYTGVAADYYDFRSDGKVYSQLDDEKDTVAYKVLGNTQIVIDGDTADLKTLTSSQLVIYKAYKIGTDTLKTTLNLKK